MYFRPGDLQLQRELALDLAVELDAGQFADDVRLNLAKSGLGEEAASVRMLHRMGGEVVAVDAVLAEVEKMMKG